MVQYSGRVQTLTDAAGQRVYPVRAISMLGVSADWDQASCTALIGENTACPPSAVQLPDDLAGRKLQNWRSPPQRGVHCVQR